MDGWGRQRSDNYGQEVGRTRSQNRKPPHGSGSWQPTVPSWEKKFCTMVGSVPWGKLLDTKKFIHLYDNILKWNDSAGEEAFTNAKNRFWAEINGLPCEISLPGPDIYIDKIDWDSEIDPELILDLENESISPADQENSEQVVILCESLVSNNHLFSPTGWGDAEDDVKQTGLSSEIKGNPWEGDWGQAKESVGQNDGWENVCNNDPWCGMKDSGWEDGWNTNSCGWNQWDNNIHNIYESDNVKYGKNSGSWEPYDANDRNRENSGRYTSRYKTSRFHGDDNLTNREWRNGNRRKRVNFGYEQQSTDKRQWNLKNSCAPVRQHHGAARQGHQWSWEKPVS